MGIHVIKMPDIGEGIAEVELVMWHVKVGDAVTEDMILADVMTDKATIEIPSPVHGTVAMLGGAAGQVMAVGADLIHIEVEGAGNLKPQSAAAAAPAVASAPAPVPAAAPVAPAAAPVADKPAATPAAAKPAAVPAATSSAASTRAAREAGERPLASPAVRKRAWDMGVELQFVHGSGPAGRILHSDLDSYVARGVQDAPSAGPGGYRENHTEQTIPVIGLRRKIAQKMQESKRRIPHFSYVEEIDVTELESLRARMNEQWGKERGKLTVLPLLARALVVALRQFPQMNARYDDDAGVVTQYGAVHLGVATQTDAGLMVSVMRHAEALDLWSCATEIGRLADAARTGKATREELSGSTITISSLGALGGIVTTPVINHPEVAIIGVNKIVERPMVRQGGLVVRKMMNLSSSFDHRVVDGMHAAQFVQAIRALLECPAMLFVE
ncbi:dihydrolipoamide acetyltransferase family protein [Pseudoduganella violacea]|uniref:Dihydrolipoamide acetyltransferase component of pyruvate dehydrogenase complex n=1 Tax=Pseudoduganella violacea TaxID=1715466 RepID=A0A7W5BEQ8_9BURK|nr:dihydrolipoamide acetyltransferase family protein [Pseudoduganella violacea]MBB3121787.1 2-oxoisovalerate dehydrogenase E2 component (dihydrolipoyl transacylase) [Pseudoduganella violacea]